MPVFRDVAPPAPETRNADALRHVLAIVPLVELGAPLRRDPVPDRDDSLTRRDFDLDVPIHFGLRFCRNAVTLPLGPAQACRKGVRRLFEQFFARQ